MEKGTLELTWKVVLIRASISWIFYARNKQLDFESLSLGEEAKFEQLGSMPNWNLMEASDVPPNVFRYDDFLWSASALGIFKFPAFCFHRLMITRINADNLIHDMGKWTKLKIIESNSVSWSLGSNWIIRTWRGVLREKRSRWRNLFYIMNGSFSVGFLLKVANGELSCIFFFGSGEPKELRLVFWEFLRARGSGDYYRWDFGRKFSEKYQVGEFQPHWLSLFLDNLG